MTALSGSIHQKPNGATDTDRARTGVLVSTSPATGRKLGEIAQTPVSDAPQVIARSKRAQTPWFRAGLDFRLGLMRNLRNVMHRDMDDMMAVLMNEIGKPPLEALSEFWPTIDILSYFIKIAPRTLAPQHRFYGLWPHRIHWIERRPFGVVLVISPWNFPYYLSMPAILAALITGNTVVFKPSEFSPLSGERLAKAIHDAGIPRDVFQIVHGAGDLGKALIAAKPDKIAFVGSVPTGRKIAAQAGELLIPCTLELGAKDAAIVLEDADLDRAAHGIAWGALYNSGQVCASIEKVYVARMVADAFIKKLVAMVEKHVRVGPGEGLNVTMGAIATPPQIKVVESQVDDAVAQGATVIIGGRRLGGPNNQYFAPTIMTNVRPEMRIMNEETFGPIIPIIPFDTEDEALEMVNSSPYGLTGSVWTRNRERGIALASRMDVGHAGVNDHILSANVPSLPWGGVKDSGYGSTRGVEGLMEMTRPQVFSVERFASLPAELFWYPYAPWKFNILRYAMKFLYAPTLIDKLKALIGR